MDTDEAPFLLLRGLIREQRHWGRFITVLQQHHPNTEIITLDIPGNGHLYKKESPDTIAKMTEALRQQLNTLPSKGPINLIALSMGGMIAIDWMNRYPKEIAAGVLISTSLSSYSPFYQRLRWQNYLSFLQMCRQTPAQKEQTILTLTSNLERDNLELLAAWQDWQHQYPVSLKNALRQIEAAAAFKSAQKPSQPLLIITSKADRLVDYRCSVKLHQAWQTAFELHLTAGHDVPLDDPLWVSRTIKNWFSQLAN